MQAEQVLQFQGHDPLSATLDEVLQAVHNLYEAVLVHDGHVSGVQPVPGPQLLTLFWVLVVRLGQPGGSGLDLAGLPPVVGHGLSIGGDDAEFDQGDGESGGDGLVQLLFLIPLVLHVWLEIGDGENGAGLGHAIAGPDLDAQFGCGQGQALGQARAANDHLPPPKVHLLDARGIDNHLQDGGDAVTEGDLVADDQFHKHRGFVLARIDLFEAHQSGQVGDAPGVDMEHRGERHVHVVLAQGAIVAIGGNGRGHRQRMQCQLPLGEKDALGPARRARRVG